MDTTTTRCCIACKQDLPIAIFGKDKSTKDGLNIRCKPCKRLHVKGIPQYTQAVRHPDAAPPRQVDVMTGHYVPACDTYYRNDGHKHIKSRGF